MTDNWLRMGAVELIKLMNAGALSAQEYATDVIRRVVDHHELNAIACFDGELLVENARLADHKRAEGKGGKLCGLPLIAKDNINTMAFPTTAGTTALQHHTPESNAGVITDLEHEDGIIAAKAGMHELAFGITSNNAVSGAIRHPHDPTKIPGGSSGGTAVAIAANIFPAGLGTDTGASVRLPAALCGITGFRPSIGRYKSDGIVPISHTRDTVGPMARCVEDIVLLDEVLAGQRCYMQKKDLSDIVLGLSTDVHFDNLEPEVETAIQAQLRVLEAAGAKLVEVNISDIWSHNEAFSFPVVLYEFMRELPSYLQEHAPEIAFDELVEKIASADVKSIVESQFGDGAVPEEIYRAALGVHRPAMRSIWAEAFKTQGLTALVFPTSPVRARNIGDDATIELNGAQVPTFPTYIRNTDLGSNLGVPGISLPCQHVMGLPVGIEFDGALGSDKDIMELAMAVEEALAL